MFYRRNVGGIPVPNPKPNYVVMPLECPFCQEQQNLHLRARTGPVHLSEETIKCVKCELDFKILVPDKIIGGPFGRPSRVWGPREPAN
jgi:hypothetical protein